MDASTTTKPGYLQPALVGGLFAGVLSALPFVNVLNGCCCLWIVSGGLVAAYLLQQNRATPITPGDGALVGLLAGVAAVIISTVVSIPLDMVMRPLQGELVQRILDSAADIPPDLRRLLEQAGDPNSQGQLIGRVALRVLGFMFFLVIGSSFSTLGGLLGAVIFSKRMKAPTPDSL